METKQLATCLLLEVVDRVLKDVLQEILDAIGGSMLKLKRSGLGGV